MGKGPALAPGHGAQHADWYGDAEGTEKGSLRGIREPGLGVPGSMEGPLRVASEQKISQEWASEPSRELGKDCLGSGNVCKGLEAGMGLACSRDTRRLARLEERGIQWWGQSRTGQGVLVGHLRTWAFTLGEQRMV